MSSFWNIWVWTLSLGTLVGCFLLLRMCLKNFTDVEEGESMGHSFDGIEELNNPLPIHETPPLDKLRAFLERSLSPASPKAKSPTFPI